MIRCEIIANQSVQEEITVLLEEKVPDIQYTIVPLVTGRGKNSYKLGNSTWPETNFLLISYIDDKDLSMVKAVVSAVKQKFTGEGIELFCILAILCQREKSVHQKANRIFSLYIIAPSVAQCFLFKIMIFYKICIKLRSYNSNSCYA